MKTTLKKSLSLVLSVALLVTSLVIPMVISAETEGLDIWDGTYVQPGDADKDGVLEIYTPEELAWFVKNSGRSGPASAYPGTTAKLMNDIWLNDMLVTVKDGVPSATKATDTSVVIDLADDANNGLREWFDGVNNMWFVGSIDGNSHVVNGLYVKHNAEYSSNTYGAGLVPRLGEAAKLTNIGIENSYMNTTADYTSAFIVGSVHSAKATVINCYVGESCYHSGKNAAAIVGGGGSGAFIKDCYSLATIVKNTTDGGVILGNCWNSANVQIYHCYTAHGYAIRRGSFGTPVESYSFEGVPTVEDMKYLGGAYLVTDGYPVLRSFVEDADKGWNGLLETPYDYDGDTIPEVSNASAFYTTTIPGTQWKTVEITDDIIFNDITVKIEDGVGVIYDAKGNKVEDLSTLNQWHTGQTACSNVKIDGAGHTVKGIFSNYTFASGSNNNQGIAIFNKAWDCDVKNLRIVDMYLDVTGGTAAGIAANIWSQDKNDVDTCIIDGYISGDHAAGVFGCGGQDSNKLSTVANSAIVATIKAKGGKVGAISGDIWGCLGWKVSNTYSVAKFWGNNQGSTSMCHDNVTLANVQGSLGTSLNNLRNFAITDTYPVPELFAENKNIWGGFLAGNFAEGDGSEENPYIISNGGELARALVVASGENAYFFKLANDIYLNDLSKVNWDTGEVAEGYPVRNWYKETAVQGTFIGDGHMVYGLYGKFNEGNVGATWFQSTATALFPRARHGSTLNVSGMGIDYAYLNANSAAGGFVGGKSGSGGNSQAATNCYVNINESFVGENVHLIAYDTGAAMGIIHGSTVTVTDFYSLAKQTYKSEHGITADGWLGKGILTRVYNATGKLDSKGSSTSVNSYAAAAGCGAAVVTEAAMKGKNATVAMAKLGDKFVATATYPALKLFADNYDENDVLGKFPFIGSGTEEAPYLVITATDLYNMVALGGQGAYYKLANDIYVNDVNAVNWTTGEVNEGYTPTEWFGSTDENGNNYVGFYGNTSFTGTVDGNGYAVHGLYYEIGNVYTAVGLIPYSGDLTVKNLGIEDSFIGGGRFTGGFVGFTYGSINLENCYIDDSCAVWGWDAGAAYVDSDGDVGINGDGGKLCMGSATYTYKEDAAGTYKFDEETGKYVKIAEDETYEGTRYAVDDVIFDGVNFTSEALAGLVARYASKTTNSITNCYVTAEVKYNPLFIFGSNDQGVTFKNPGKQGSSGGHLGGLWGDDWAAVVNASNCFSIIVPHEHNVDTASNLYTLANVKGASQVKVSNAQGATALDEMTALSGDVWYAVLGSVDYPQLRVRGEAIGDVDENGIGAEFTDTAALRMTIIGANNNLNANFNREGNTDVRDLVALTLEAQKKNKLEEEANAKLLPKVYVSDKGSNEGDGSADAPVKTLAKAYSMVQDGGDVMVDDTVTVTSMPKGNKSVVISGGVVDMTSLDTVSFGCNTIFVDCTLKFKDDATVYANGNNLIVETNVEVEGTPAAIFGGGTSAVAETYLDLRSGSYKKIYGGGDNGAVLGDAYLYLTGNVNADLPLTAAGASYVYGGSKTGTVYGDTVVVIEGNVNAPLDHESHTAIARLYGGSENGNVNGSTNVTVAENAEFSYIYGGCAKGTVGGATYIDFSGKAMSIYGGSGTVYETNVTVNGGWVHQVFGGCEGSSMTGNTTVTIKGGTIDRRVAGGCYNNANREGLSMVYTSENYVTGNTTVILYDEATYTLSGDDYGITALSRHKTNHEAENGTIVFENSALQNKLNNKLGIKWVLGTLAPAADTQTVGF